MNLTDKEYLESIENVFDLLPSFFNSDTGIGLTDTEEFLIVSQPESFKLNVAEGMKLVKDGASEKAIRTRTTQLMCYPKEAFGFPIVGRAIPIVNKSTGNVIGTIVYAVSQEKEDSISLMANELHSYVEQLSGSAQEMAGSAEELTANSQSASGLVNETAESINKMDDILGYITEISNTTNLLGLNAAIEAARAGENGRGFNVVAQEIRKLAAQSKTSIVNITESLQKIKRDMNEILKFIDTFSNTSESQAAQAEQLAASSEGINELSAKLLKFAKELNS